VIISWLPVVIIEAVISSGGAGGGGCSEGVVAGADMLSFISAGCLDRCFPSRRHRHENYVCLLKKKRMKKLTSVK
jgi:hypothetical protein